VAKQIVAEPVKQRQMTVPFMDLRSEHQKLRRRLMEEWELLLDSAAFVGGSQVQEFERSFSNFCRVEHAIGVANGTDALVLALKALGVGANDEVITAANSFVATAEAIVHAGATPILVDVDPQTYNIDIGQVERHISSRTKAIIPVHLYGLPADMTPLLMLARSYGLKVIEDSSQAHGARYHGRMAGSMGDAACFSFYPAKNLGACGDGGAVVTNDEGVAMAVRKLRDHGGARKYEHQTIGYNSRLDSLQAAVLNVKLPGLDQRNELRRKHAQTYRALLSDLPQIALPLVPEGLESVYHLYVIRLACGRRSELQRYLQERGVQTAIHYPTPIHRTEAFAGVKQTACPVAERYAESILSLPMFPELETQQVEYVASLLQDYFLNLEGRKQ
jgi:dTDP-4-amino-4,6-dideoxygalactose transaminase